MSRRVAFLLCFAASGCNAPGPPDAGADVGPDVGVDAGTDAGNDAGRPITSELLWRAVDTRCAEWEEPPERLERGLPSDTDIRLLWAWRLDGRQNPLLDASAPDASARDGGALVPGGNFYNYVIGYDGDLYGVGPSRWQVMRVSRHGYAVWVSDELVMPADGAGIFIAPTIAPNGDVNVFTTSGTKVLDPRTGELKRGRVALGRAFGPHGRSYGGTRTEVNAYCGTEVVWRASVPASSWINVMPDGTLWLTSGLQEGITPGWAIHLSAEGDLLSVHEPGTVSMFLMGVFEDGVWFYGQRQVGPDEYRINVFRIDGDTLYREPFPDLPTATSLDHMAPDQSMMFNTTDRGVVRVFRGTVTPNANFSRTYFDDGSTLKIGEVPNSAARVDLDSAAVRWIRPVPFAPILLVDGRAFGGSSSSFFAIQTDGLPPNGGCFGVAPCSTPQNDRWVRAALPVLRPR